MLHLSAYLISVVICTCGISRLRLVLDGYKRQTFKSFEIIVVSDGGEDVSELLAEYQGLQIKYLYFGPRDSEFRLAKARNIGIENASGNRVVFTDSDCVPSETFLERHVQHLGDDTVVIGVRSRVHIMLANLLDQYKIDDVAGFIYTTDNRITKLYDNPVYYYFLEYLAFGCNVSYGIEPLKKLGGFNDKFVGWGCEDIELATRARYSQGCGLVLYPDSVVYHLDHVSSDIDSPQTIRNREILIDTRRRLKCPIL